jgi:hypothetical protein
MCRGVSPSSYRGGGTTSHLVAVHHRSSASADDRWGLPWVGTLVVARVPCIAAVGGNSMAWKEWEAVLTRGHLCILMLSSAVHFICNKMES